MHRENENFRDEHEGGRDRPGCCRGRDERSQGRPDHLDQTAREWEEAFFEALHEVRVDVLKARIKAAWGKNIDATSKEVVAAMFADWQEFQKREKAEKKDPSEGNARASLREILKKGMRKGPQ